jgi:hypothetical protein
VSARLRGVHLGHERRVVRRRGPLHRVSSPNACRVAGSRRAVVLVRRFRSPDEVLSLFVSGDVEVRFSKQLFGGGQRFLQYGSDEGRVIRSPVEVLNHCYLSDLGDVISHGLKPLEVRPKCCIPSAPDGFEVPCLCRLVGEGLKVGDEAPTEVAPIIDAVSWQVS